MINSAQSNSPTHQNFFLNTLRNFGRLFHFTNTATVSPLDSKTVKTSQKNRAQSAQSSSRNGRKATHSQSWLYDSSGFSRAQTRIAMEASIRTFEAENEKRETDYQKRLKTAIANSIKTNREEEAVRVAVETSLETPKQDPIANKESFASTSPAETQQKQNVSEQPTEEQQRSTGSDNAKTAKAPPPSAPKGSEASVNAQPAESTTESNTTPTASHKTRRVSTDDAASAPKPAPASVSASVSAQVEAPKFVYHSPQLLKSLTLVLRSPRSTEPEIITFESTFGFTSLEVLLDPKQNNEPVPDLTPISRSNSASSISESPEEIDLVEAFDPVKSIDEQRTVDERSAPTANAHAAHDPTNFPLYFPDELRARLLNHMVDVNLDPVGSALTDSMLLLDGFDLDNGTHEQISALLETFRNIQEPSMADMQNCWNSISNCVLETPSVFGNAHLWIYLTKMFSSILECNLEILPDDATIRLSNASPAANTPKEFTIPINAFIHATNLITSHSEKLWDAGSLRVGDSIGVPVTSGTHWTSFILKRVSENKFEVTFIDSAGNGQISKRSFNSLQEYNAFCDLIRPTAEQAGRETINSKWREQMSVEAGNAVSDTSGFTPFAQDHNTCHFFSVVNAINYFAHISPQNTAR